MDKMPVAEHLGDLRKRIVTSLAALTIAFSVCFYYSENIFSILTMPLHNILKFSLSEPYFSFEPTGNQGIELFFFEPAEALWMHFKIAFIAGFILSSPVIFYQVWKFISPGLLLKEKRYALPFVLVTTFLFSAGALFCFIIVLPFAMNFLLTYKTQNLKPMLSVGKYIDFCMKFILGFGVVFELPVVLVFLTKMGIVTTEFLGKNRKYAILIAFILAAFLTPTPDAFNQTLMAVPIIILYEIGIWASVLLNIKKKTD
ncbi:MAG: twin-arginine translocase subunit TatC [Thermodesulfovibrionia bacterium]|nr:twin-arginine translocase subunit TatC [Thermodesulfovibrionia bacterium]